MNAVRLCFQVFLPDDHGKMTRNLPPVVSQPIYDKGQHSGYVVVNERRSMSAHSLHAELNFMLFVVC